MGAEEDVEDETDWEGGGGMTQLEAVREAARLVQCGQCQTTAREAVSSERRAAPTTTAVMMALAVR